MIGASKHIHLNQTTSTNSYLKELISMGVELPELTLVDAEFQTGGRGQRGNSWESNKGENLTFSLLCHPVWMPAANQFLLSQAIAVAVQDVLSTYTDGISIKWPNDIYWNDKKISGILIECDIEGMNLRNCIIGVGLNVNQTKFVSDAPNPISLSQIIGFSLNRNHILEELVERFLNIYNKVKEGNTEDLTKQYKNSLFRKEGFHKYAEPEGEDFSAEIIDVLPNGHLLLKKEDGQQKEYEFKEVKFII